MYASHGEQDRHVAMFVILVEISDFSDKKKTSYLFNSRFWSKNACHS
jgi:hypothetical protein